MNRRRILYRLLLTVWLTAGFLLSSLAQQRIMFSHLTQEDGLSQNTVLCIIQDARGFMWFGTQEGLNRYDGYGFTVFRNDPRVQASLSGSFVTFLAVDSSGVLWVGTWEHPELLDRYDPASESFSAFPRDSVNLTGADINAARSFYEDLSGNWWYGGRDAGLTRFDPTSGKSTVYKNDPSNPASIAHDNVYQIVEDPNGMLWVSTFGGLDRFNPKTGIFEHFRHSERDPRSISDDETWPLLVDRNGDLWVGTYGGGLNRFDRETETFTHFRNEELNPRSIAGDRLYSLYQDRTGLIWVGTGDHGVDRFHPELAAFAHYSSNPSDPRSLSDNNIQSIAVDQKGMVWLGTRNGLNRLDRETNRFDHFKHSPSDPGSISENNIAPALLIDRSGILWIGTSNSGLDRYDPSTHRFRNYRHNPSIPTSLSENLVYALAEDRSGDIWVGTYTGGLNRLDRATGKFKVYRFDETDETSLGAEGVWALLEDREGVLWVGTSGGGLDRFDRQTESFTHYRHSNDDPLSLSADLVLCLFEDRTGILWVGTTGGLSRLDRQTNSFTHYQERDGLAGNIVFGILEDSRGNLWMSTSKGISRFNPQTGEFLNFDYTDGLQGDEFNQGAYAQDPKTGEMFFGGSNGFSCFDPSTAKRNPNIPPVVITSFVRYNADDVEGQPIAENGVSAQSEIEISYKENLAIFEFAALNFYNTAKNQYSYQLEGFNESWIRLGTDHRATFTIPGGGEYVLHVRGSNNNGVWNEEGTSLRLIVTPPWWETRWAYASYAVIAIAFLYGLRRFEINRREQKAKMREAELYTKAVEAEKKVLVAENERKTKELEDARRLQLSMLPNDLPTLTDYEIAVFMRTATEVGGDYYDFSPSNDGRVDVAFGDATGHGMQAGTIVTLMKGLFLGESTRYEIPEFLGHCSRAIKSTKLGRLLMAFTLVRINGKSVSLSTAGMPPVFVYRKSSGSVEEILLNGMPLGAMKNFPYTFHETTLDAGDTLLLLTDGLPEQKNKSDEMFDYARVQSTFAQIGQDAPDDIISRLVKEGDAWMDGVSQDDDITFMVIRRKARTS